MPPLLAFVLGLLLGLGIGTLVVVGLVRATSRITGAAPRAIPGLVLDGLRSGARQDGVAAQRALARRIKKTGERAASGRRVAATELQVHVSPEDHALIDGAMGVEAAQSDLGEFYRTHAGRSGWLIGSEPELSLVRDISLRPRQVFVRSRTVAVPGVPLVARSTGDDRAAAADAPASSDRPPIADRPPVAARAAEVVHDAGVMDVLPRGLAEEDATVTAVYPSLGADHAAAGDLVVVHGTDVRVVPASLGLLTIGRGRHNDVVLNSPGVGRDHLLIEHRPDGWWLVPGTTGEPPTLDGARLAGPTRLEGQGRVELGRGARLQLSVEPAR